MLAGTANIVRTIRTGSSGAIVRIVEQRDGRRIAIKTATAPRVPAVLQAERRALIEPYFANRLPRVLFAGRRNGRDTLITECPATATLAEALDDAHSFNDAMKAWADLAATLTSVWKMSTYEGYDPKAATRQHHLRLVRAVHGLDFVSSTVGRRLSAAGHIVVNDVDHGTWQQAQARLAALVPPHVRVACHGDPHPGNVLLGRDGNWHLVDWEWSGLHHDWRMMTSHLFGYWYVADLLADGTGHLAERSADLHLDFCPPPNPGDDERLLPAARAFNAMSDGASRAADLEALALHLAMLLLRELPRVAADGRIHHLAPLLGESIRLVHTAATAQHPLIRWFA